MDSLKARFLRIVLSPLAVILMAPLLQPFPAAAEDISDALLDKLAAAKAVSTAKSASAAIPRGGPTCTIATLSCGQTVTGLLQTSDCALSDGTFVDFWTFDGSGGDSVVVDLESEDFDTFLFLLDPTPDVVAVDDDSGLGTNSRLGFDLGESGEWSIAVNNFSVVAGDPGAYSLTLACTLGGSIREIPTLNTVSLAGLVILLGGIGLVLVRRRTVSDEVAYRRH